MWKVIVDREKCTGEAICTGVAPTVFELDEERRSTVIDPRGADEDTVYEAAFRRPPPAIVLVDEATGEPIFPEPVAREGHVRATVPAPR